MEDHRDDSTPLTREEQEAMVQKAFGSDSYTAYVEGFLEASRGLDMFASLRAGDGFGNTRDAHSMSQPLGSTTVPLNGTNEYAGTDVLTSELLDRAKQIKPLLDHAEAERHAALQQEYERQETARIERDERVRISNARAAEFKCLMERNGIPTTKHYAILLSRKPSESKLVYVGDGWVVTPSHIEKDDATESAVDKHIDGLFLAQKTCKAYLFAPDRDVYRYGKYPYNLSISGTLTVVGVAQSGLTALEAPFEGDIGVSVLARALIRLGVAS